MNSPDKRVECQKKQSEWQTHQNKKMCSWLNLFLLYLACFEITQNENNLFHDTYVDKTSGTAFSWTIYCQQRTISSVRFNRYVYYGQIDKNRMKISSCDCLVNFIGMLFSNVAHKHYYKIWIIRIIYNPTKPKFSRRYMITQTFPKFRNQSINSLVDFFNPTALFVHRQTIGGVNLVINAFEILRRTVLLQSSKTAPET